MSMDGCDPALPSDTGMTAVDSDGDGYAETLLEDANRDGYAETLHIDRDRDGHAEERQQDTDLDGRVDHQIVDDNRDGQADRVFVDSNRDGVMEQQGVLPAGQPQGWAPAEQTPAAQPQGAGWAPADQGQLPADMQGSSPQDLAQWLNHPNVQNNPELEALIKRMLNFNTNAAQDFLNINPNQ